jgi:hypothetical protein
MIAGTEQQDAVILLGVNQFIGLSFFAKLKLHTLEGEP